MQSSFDSMHPVDDPVRATTIIHTGASRYHIVCDLEPEQVNLQSQDQCNSRLLTYGIWQSNLLNAKSIVDSSKHGFIVTARIVNLMVSHSHRTISNYPHRRFCRGILPIYRYLAGRIMRSTRYQNPRTRPTLRLEESNLSQMTYINQQPVAPPSRTTCSCCGAVRGQRLVG